MLNKNKGLDNCLSFLHKQVLHSWNDAYCIEPVSNFKILNEYVLYNEKIKIRKRLIRMQQFLNKYGYNLKFLDILDDQGYMLKRDSLNTKLQLKI